MRISRPHDGRLPDSGLRRAVQCSVHRRNGRHAGRHQRRPSPPSQKARVTYDNILRFADDPDVRDPIKFLREREIVHYQRFGEGLRIATDRLDSKNFYAFNPSFD